MENATPGVTSFSLWVEELEDRIAPAVGIWIKGELVWIILDEVS